MRIGIYTDVHCCYTSSVLPIHCNGTKYTTRLNMIINTFKWMYDLFEKENVDMIVNCGDLFDSHNLRSEEISAMSEALSYSKGIKEYHVLGNHEILDKNRKFYATALLENYSNISVIDTPLKLSNNISFLPYMEPEKVNEVLPYIKNDILFSHIDIQGSRLNAFYVMDKGADIQYLRGLFKLIINGHIHSYQSLGSNIYNIGATTSYSFSDDSATKPGVAIVDTHTLTFKRYTNPHAIRFIKLTDADDLKSIIERYENSIALRVDCKFENKDRVAKIISDCDNVLVSRIQTTAPVISEDNKEESSIDIDINSSTDVTRKFVEFLKNNNELKYPLDNYLKVIEDFGGVDV